LKLQKTQLSVTKSVTKNKRYNLKIESICERIGYKLKELHLQVLKSI